MSNRSTTQLRLHLSGLKLEVPYITMYTTFSNGMAAH